MKFRKISVWVAVTVGLALVSSDARAHWCDDLWASSYNIVVRPETDTVTVPASGAANLNIYVQNNMGYQLTNFKLLAKLGTTSITPTAPKLDKINGALAPGQKATWTLPISKSGGGTVKIEDLSFSVSFGNSGQSRCYPLTGGSPVMVVKTDKTMYPAKPAGLDTPDTVCGELSQARDLQYQAIAEFEDVNVGLDKLLQFYCAGRGSWGASDGVTKANCKDTASTTCPTAQASGAGSKYDYIHLWAAGELAARKSGLGARLAVLRQRLQCGVNDAEVVFGGYALFMLGYLGEDATARSFIESQISSGTGDMVGIAKAALLLMGNAADMTKYKADVTSGLASSSVYVKAASAAALGIAAKDDGAVTQSLFPLVTWTEPDTSDKGRGLFAAHLLQLVAWDRRGWVGNGADVGGVSFYGDSPTPSGGTPGGTGGTGAGGGGGAGGLGAGGAAGSGGSSGRDAGPGDAKAGAGGSSAGGSSGSGGVNTPPTTGKGGAGGYGGVGPGVGGTPVAGGGAGAGAGGAVGPGGNVGPVAGGGNGGVEPDGSDATGGSIVGSTPVGEAAAGSGCKCNLGGSSHASALSVLTMLGLALAAVRRRRR
jgi:MYXO-CTERM domain-containing protein